MKKKFLFIFLALAAFACGEDASKKEVEVEAQPEAVEKYVSEQDSFKIAFPNTPERTVDNIPVEDGSQIQMIDYTCVKDSYIYMLTISPQPSKKIETNQDIISLLTDTKNTFCSDLEMQITEEKEVRLDDNPGIFFMANSNRYYAAVSNYLVNGFIYQVTVLGNGKQVHKKQVNEFIKSFELIEKSKKTE